MDGDGLMNSLGSNSHLASLEAEITAHEIAVNEYLEAYDP
jgi:hypothetical protein